MPNLLWPDYLHEQMPSFAEDECFAVVSIAQQRLYWLRLSSEQGLQLVQTYAVSTAKNGFGNQSGSGQTPLGWHEIKLKIGQDCPVNSVFVGRRFTQEIYSESLACEFAQRDWILSRILWLSGLQSGFNRRVKNAKGLECSMDTLRRFIYVHGTPDNTAEPIGQPHSHGCIRMQNADLLAFFEQVKCKTKLFITATNFTEFERYFMQSIEFKDKVNF